MAEAKVTIGVDDDQECSGPAGSLRVCHEHIRAGVEAREPQTRWCELKATRFCWDDCAYFCHIHILSRHAGHRIQVT